MGATVSFVVPDDITKHTFGTNINVVVQRMPNQSLSLEEFCNTIKQQLDHTVAEIETTYVKLVSVAWKFKTSQFCALSSEKTAPPCFCAGDLISSNRRTISQGQLFLFSH